MLSSRRTISLVGVVLFVLLVLSFRRLRDGERWREIPQVVGMGESVSDTKSSSSSSAQPSASAFNISTQQDRPTKFPYGPRPHYAPGTAKPPGSFYSKMLVVPRIKEEDTEWIERELPDWEAAVYVADDPSAPLHPPKNKGHEVMVYLTFIIDNYENLPDIMAFMHAHQMAWHNDDILDWNAAEMLRRLNPNRVAREGYMNMRCNWSPGCPDWMHPGTLEEDSSKQEETMLARSWSEIFPNDPIPDVLAQPCCAQFALSRERVLAIPKSRFVFYRDWLLRTELSDYISGRVWEYLWHVVFTGENVFCPLQNVCYCDGFGLCFGGEAEMDEFFGIRFQRNDLQEELDRWREKSQDIENARASGLLGETSDLEIPEVGRDAILQEQIDQKNQMLYNLKMAAMERGNDPRHRAKEAGRPWKEGDGF
ncbi:hypothetical protein C8Q69DRAFT_396414 [Paecilomyces variotii]|uniref:Uncharacterized protein n=1 Tax=Byssochlamys spectabilis TaxID=264951 RepID=A0A443I7N7_BYSSP|nr:hypothetical protein C8Q69DRAFT_396414 [Paecilomyces variotii]KAJ9357749.1 hypothetical protein DTO280E4_5515 [Paecilomyces variotii]RWR00059.1 hypothetical protein C8Q69DRAFT_396414 [Paecilomyces variotii]